MKIYKIFLVIFIQHQFAFQSFSQDIMKEQKYDQLCLFYVDNSSGYDLPALNNDLKDTLNSLLKEQLNVPNTRFYFFGSNGSGPKQNSSLSDIFESDMLVKYLSRPSVDADYQTDKQSIREQFSYYPVKIKQSLEINYFLSSKAIDRLFDDVNMIPTPLVLQNELLLYLHAGPDIKVRCNIFFNKELVGVDGEQGKYTEDQILKCFMFYFSKENVRVVVQKV
jgi:hypothetical protein